MSQFPPDQPADLTAEGTVGDEWAAEDSATDTVAEPGPDVTEHPAPTAESDEIVVVAVESDDESSMPDIDEAALQELADEHRQELGETIAAVQQELAGMTKTGVPAVDDALDQLGRLDPQDLAGSSEILAQVLAQLESVMNETPQE